MILKPSLTVNSRTSSKVHSLQFSFSGSCLSKNVWPLQIDLNFCITNTNTLYCFHMSYGNHFPPCCYKSFWNIPLVLLSMKARDFPCIVKYIRFLALTFSFIQYTNRWFSYTTKQKKLCVTRPDQDRNKIIFIGQCFFN